MHIAFFRLKCYTYFHKKLGQNCERDQAPHYQVI